MKFANDKVKITMITDFQKCYHKANTTDSNESVLIASALIVLYQGLNKALFTIIWTNLFMFYLNMYKSI